MNKTIKNLFIVLLFIVSFLSLSCNLQNFQGKADSGSITLTINSEIFENTPNSNVHSRAIRIEDISKIKVSIIGSNIITPIDNVFTLITGNGSTGTVTINDIPIGINRAVKVTAFDSNNNIIPNIALFGTLDVFPGNNSATINKASTPRGQILWNLIESDLANGTNYGEIDCAQVETYVQQIISDNSLASPILVDATAISNYIISNSGSLPSATSYFIEPAEISFDITGLGVGINNSQIIVNDPLSNAKPLSGDGSYSIEVYPGTWQISFEFFNKLLTIDYSVDASTQGATITSATDSQNNVVDLTNLDFSGDIDLSIDAGSMTYTEVDNIQFQNHQMYVPQGILVPSVQPTGDFDGAIIQSSDGDFAGFGAVSQSYNNESSSNTVLTNRTNIISSNISGSVNLISKKNSTTNDMVNAQYSVTISSPITSIELNNQILNLIGSTVQGGTITNLPPTQNTNTSYTNFRYYITIKYINSTEIIIISSLVPESEVSTFEALINGFNDGTNIGSSSSTLNTTQDTYAAQSGNNDADFLFVIDNSGSMREEQSAISSAASEFWNKMTSAGLDFNVGVITTDSQSLRGTGFTTDQTQFQSDVRPGTNGSAYERGIYFSELSLLSTALGDSADGSVTTAGYPRRGASLSVIIMSDEESQYPGSFDCTNNLFVDRDYKVYSIINTSSPGQYDDLANTSGGLVASINDTTQFPTIMTQIATEAGGATSSYVLTNSPISSTIAVYINNTLVPNSSTDGWAYIESNNSIIFYGSYIPNSGDSVDVVYKWIS